MVLDIESIIEFIFFFFKNIFTFSYFFFNKNFFLGKTGILNYFFIFFFSKIYLCFFNDSKFLVLILFFLKNVDILYFDKFFLYDFYFPFTYNKLSGINLLTSIIDKVKKFFYNLNFIFLNSSDIENGDNNFLFLNISYNHPSTFFSDTFYINNYFFDKFLLRTHTSNIHSKIKFLKNFPLKFFHIGKVYRPDNDSFHLPMFTQLEVIFIDKNIKNIFLKKFFLHFISYIFGKGFFCRFRNTFFPFTLFSYEVDLIFFLNKKKKWLEIAGMGIIHPLVMKNVFVNYNYYNGFAFGIGLERLVMIYYKLSNLNILFNDYFCNFFN